MEAVTTYKYIADDGKEFSSEEACKEWEQQKKGIRSNRTMLSNFSIKNPPSILYLPCCT